MLVTLLASHRNWELFKTNPTKTVLGLISSRLQTVAGDTSIPEQSRLSMYENLLKLNRDFQTLFNAQPFEINESVSSGTLSHETGAQVHPRMPRDAWAKLLQNLPSPLVEKCKDLVQGLRQFPSILNCNEQGELILKGRVIPGSHCGDLLSILMSKSMPGSFDHLKKFWRDRQVAGLEEFLRGYSETGLASRLLKNSFFSSMIQTLRKN